MSWPNEEQMDFLKSRAQAWEDSNGDSSARTKFWDQLHRDWAERWLPRRRMENTFSRHFRVEMENRRAIARGAAPKPATRRWVPRMSAPTLSELEHRRARGAPSSSPEYFSTTAHSTSCAQPPREEMQNQRVIARAPNPATRRWVPRMSAPTPRELEHRQARGAPSSSPEYFSTTAHSPSRAQFPRHHESPTSPTAGDPHPPIPMRMSRRKSPRHPKPQQLCPRVSLPLLVKKARRAEPSTRAGIPAAQTAARTLYQPRLPAWSFSLVMVSLERVRGVSTCRSTFAQRVWASRPPVQPAIRAPIVNAASVGDCHTLAEYGTGFLAAHVDGEFPISSTCMCGRPSSPP
ncbi:hypothetical protein CCMSSC00406_0009560 [Pleurotus cornucopiae]|uniref:Uncharacterized protein n=1 Tax=Pleurotus cornucopiae TaxID=5321 RepID=A0ACB7IRU8_PLECO|nr:hypothetical protein CCMSSC00406_0009560 [Pleurotus cornucopiae]